MDVSAWIEPVPELAARSWCLPAQGGRVAVRGYDTYRSTLKDIAGSSRWGLDETYVPVSPAAEARTHGPGGLLHPGDCVVFFGVGAGSSEPMAWFPQRIIDADAPSGGWQRVLAIRDLSVDPDAVAQWEEYQVKAANLLDVGEPLHGAMRSAVLHACGLAVDCPECGGRGRPFMYGLPMEFPGPHWAIGGCIVEMGQPDYECPTCSCEWRVTTDGGVIVVQEGCSSQVRVL